VVAATPLVAIERSFGNHGVVVSQVRSAPELCDRAACTGLDVWDGSGKVVYLAPRQGRDFMIAVFATAAAARRIGAFERTKSGMGTDVRGTALLVYLPSSARIAQLRAALAAVR
jgi:hypothetical protein